VRYRTSAHNQRSTAGRSSNGLQLDRWGKRRQRGEPYDVLNGTIDREKDASRVCFLIQERLVPVEYSAQGNTA
jgi:hypothetical protein